MKILLPPSETKHPGGDGAPLDVGSLAFPTLRPQRESVIDALVELSGDEEVAASVLKLSVRQRGDVEHNRRLRDAPTMPAADRYTGVLYDALDARSLSAAARRWLGAHVVIHSAPFGPVGALDLIPAYRLAAGTSLPGVPALRRHWAEATSAALGECDAILDLRSEAYVALGPVPGSVPSAYVRVVTDQGKALNHFNKKAKGELVRALAEQRPKTKTLEGFRRWAAANGIALRTTTDVRVWELVTGN